VTAWLIEDSEDIEAAIRGDGDEVPDGLDRSSREAPKDPPKEDR
jgi:hypothetical protein